MHSTDKETEAQNVQENCSRSQGQLWRQHSNLCLLDCRVCVLSMTLSSLLSLSNSPTYAIDFSPDQYYLLSQAMPGHY